jgi:hypothetical protein
MTDEQQNQNKEQLAAAKKLAESYQMVFGSDEGIEVLKDLSRRCFVASTTNVPGDANQSAFNEGTRSVLLFVNNMINYKE